MHILPLPNMPAPVPDAGFGALSTEQGNLPLEFVEVHATVTGLVAGVEVGQGFRNPHGVPVEATYIFPLPDRAAVTAMTMEAADRVVEAKLEERGKARADYDAAIEAGQRAAIAEEDRPDVFTMRVGNILPGEHVTVRLTLAQPVPYEDGAALFRFPLVVAPRYIPGTPIGDAPAGDGVASDTDAVPDASRISPPVLLPGFPYPVRLALSVELDPAGLPVGQVHSSLHVTAAETGADGRTTISLLPGERLDRDFVLRLGFDRQQEAAAVLDERGTFTLTVLPSGAVTPRPRDVVLVLDRSGSMGGWKMVAARRAAARVVDTLTAADRFAALSFDHEIDRPGDLPSGLVAATDRHRFRAVEHLAGLAARGGTEMYQPLHEAAGLLTDQTRDRVLVLVTDGQIGNEDQILARLAPMLAGVRVHTIGIDQAVNAGFLNRLAQMGQGRAELVESEDRLDEAMEHIHHRIGAPLATGLSLTAEGGLRIVEDTVAPRRLGALYPGVPLVVSGRWEGGGDGALTVRGTAADGTPWSQTAPAVRADAPAATAVWARAHLRDLEDDYAVKGTQALEQRIVETSLTYSVLCRFTAFVAIDSRVVTEGGTPHKVVQPVERPRGWADPGVPAVTMAAVAMPRGTARRSGPRTAMAGGPVPAVPPAMPAPGSAFGRAPAPSEEELDVPDFLKADPVAEIRAFAAGELARLTGPLLAYAGVEWDMLADLRRRLRDVAPGLPADAVRLLAELERALAVLDDADVRRTDPADLWQRAIRLLTQLAAVGGQARRPFWKRGSGDM
jgi:Ca-activated chloride channel family protein